MGASATMSTSVIAVEPGHEATCPVVVTNNGVVVDHFVIEVVGDAAPWTVAEPPAVNLMPGESTTVVLRFAPPRSAGIGSRSIPFGVHVSSQDQPAGSVVEEGTVEVAAFTEVAIELTPAKAEGSRAARYEVVVDNAGNHPVDVELRAIDREDGLTFRFDRSRFVLDSGTAAFVPLRARPRRRFLRGEPRRHTFQVFAATGYGAPLSTEGTMVQRQLLPRWLLPALVALVVLAAALAALWFAVLRPAVKTVARSAAAEQAAAQSSELKAAAAQQAQGARQEASQAKQEAAQAKQNANRALEAQGLSPDDPNALPKPLGGASAGEPVDFRIAANAPIVTDVRRFTQFAGSPVEEGKTLLITDLILQNPRGDTGTLQILRQSNDDKPVLLLEMGLGNFRDLDEHWVQPWRFRAGEKIVVAVSCQNPSERGACTPAVSFSGRVEG